MEDSWYLDTRSYFWMPGFHLMGTVFRFVMQAKHANHPCRVNYADSSMFCNWHGWGPIRPIGISWCRVPYRMISHLFLVLVISLTFVYWTSWARYRWTAYLGENQWENPWRTGGINHVMVNSQWDSLRTLTETWQAPTSTAGSQRNFSSSFGRALAAQKAVHLR